MTATVVMTSAAWFKKKNRWFYKGDFGEFLLLFICGFHFGIGVFTDRAFPYADFKTCLECIVEYMQHSA